MSLHQWLDALAGKVIYSTENLLDPQPYIVKPQETLQTISRDWRVPPQLVYNINRQKIANPEMLIPGTELKMVKGPFRAEISLAKKEMTLFLGDMYAGRFNVELGQDVALAEGTYKVEAKSLEGRAYQDAVGKMIPANDANNPYGRFWMDLGNQVCIHGKSANPVNNDQRGCISVSQRDVADVFGILSYNSPVKIMR